MDNEGPVSDISYDIFPDSEVHKIGILDLWIFNLDWNDGNILYWKTDSGPKLIPIDHSMSIPGTLKIYSFDLCWMDWE